MSLRRLCFGVSVHTPQWEEIKKKLATCKEHIEEREISWSSQHPGRSGPSRWRGRNHRSHDDLQQDLADRKIANPVDPVLSHHTSQIGNLQHYQNYRTISLISHPSKVMLKITLNKLKPQAEKIIAEEQAGFRAGRSTTEQIFNQRILCEKYLQHQQDLCHVFIDFKKAFDRVWHAALWATMKKYNISTNLIQVIKNLHNKAISAVLFNSSIGD